MSRRRHPQGRQEPESELPAPESKFRDQAVRPGSYGIEAHVPTEPYVPPLPPDAEKAPGTPLRIVTEDPLDFLAAQAKAKADEHPLAADAPPPSADRFRPESRRGSVAPPGFKS